MNINTAINHVAIARECREISFIIRHHIVCKDGFTISVQVSAVHYCHPKRIQKYYKEFEVMCDITDDKELLERYYDGTICAYVPANVIEKVILHHGGINWKLTPKKGEEKWMFQTNCTMLQE